MSETNSLTTTFYRCAWVWIRLGHRCGRCILYSIWFSNFHSWCKAWQRGSQSMTNESIYPRLGTKSVPWLAGFPLTGTTSLIKTGRSPANMARPSFSQQSIERSGGGGPVCLRSSGIPWIKLSLFLLLLKFPMALFEHTVCQWARFTVSMLAHFPASAKSCDPDPRPMLTSCTSFLGL